MKLKAKITGYSSVVGGGLRLDEETGPAAFIVMFIGTSRGITKEEDAALSKRIADLINEHGLEVPDRVVHLDSAGKERPL